MANAELEPWSSAPPNMLRHFGSVMSPPFAPLLGLNLINVHMAS